MNKTLGIFVSQIVRRVFLQPRSRSLPVIAAVAGIALLVSALFSAVESPVSAGQKPFQLSGRVARVADGDTFTLLVKGHEHQIRLASIDAPETGQSAGRPGQPFGRASKNALSSLINGKNLLLECYERDRYQRSICDARLNQKETVGQSQRSTAKTINQIQVETGMAWANMEKKGKFLRDRRFPQWEQQARHAGLGIWQQEKPIAPWVWRYACWKQSKC